jgi:hypothetical protein
VRADHPIEKSCVADQGGKLLKTERSFDHFSDGGGMGLDFSIESADYSQIGLFLNHGIAGPQSF